MKKRNTTLLYCVNYELVDYIVNSNINKFLL